jgi:hypothetical protein
VFSPIFWIQFSINQRSKTRAVLRIGRFAFAVVYAALAMKPAVAKEESYCDICYGPSGIAWPALGGLAGRPLCELLGFGLAFPSADETDQASYNNNNNKKS